jgi:sugar phosphate isomerase/epimerase
VTNAAVNRHRAGVFASSLRDTRVDVPTALRLARLAGFGACLFSTAFDLSARLDRFEIDEWREAGTEAGVAVRVCCPNLHPYRTGEDRRLLAAGDGDAFTGLRRVFEASARLGGRDLTVIIGRIEDRFDRLTPWPAQLDAAAALLRRLAPVLRDTGIRLAIKTHEEISSFEAVRLVEAAGPDEFGIAYDPVNVLVNLEDPVRAAARVGHLTSQVMLEDAELDLVGEGARRLLCPIGEGVVDWPAVLAAVDRLAPEPPMFWIELHRGQFGVRPFDVDWLTNHGDLDLAEYAAAMSLIATSRRRLTPARLAHLEVTQARPTTRLPHAISASKALLARERREAHPTNHPPER